jgi:hypothetical protein
MTGFLEMLHKTNMVMTIQKNFSGNADIENTGVSRQRGAAQKRGPQI